MPVEPHEVKGFLDAVLKDAFIEELKVSTRPTTSTFVDPKLQHLRTMVKVEMWLYREAPVDVPLRRD